MIPAWRSGVATDAGRVRLDNEDRFYVDEGHGVFAVVDGVGGNAAGETAAEIATEVLAACLAADGGGAAQRIPEAIAAANNRIYERASADPDCQGMACVLTVAVIERDLVTIGHVGDSRLYLIWNGSIKKMTPDHSPVGEREDRGELSEEEAMLHPRRHEVFRDVGSHPREASDAEFIELKEFPLKPDAAILLCSDGLSDALTSAQMREIIERYDGDPGQTARDLVDAANLAGGADNITAIFVAGPEFLGHASPDMEAARERHSITRPRAGGDVSRPLAAALSGRLAFLIYGLLLGMLLAAALLTTLRVR